MRPAGKALQTILGRFHLSATSTTCVPAPQLALGALVNFFFSGFILGKTPFALSPKFRVMLQVGWAGRGVVSLSAGVNRQGSGELHRQPCSAHAHTMLRAWVGSTTTSL